MKRRPRRLLPLALGMALAVPAVAGSESAPDVGRPFVATPASPRLYDIQRPLENPGLQRHIIEASDGSKLFLETWLPKAKGGNTPPSQIPTVLVVTPYVKQGVLESPTTLNAVVPRGYAYSQLHVRGTGESGGCLEDHTPQEVDDAARAIEYLGRDAPWTNGVVGGYGVSYPGGSMFSVAAEGDPERIQYLKAFVIGAPVASRYDTLAQDGVPQIVEGPVGTLTDIPISFAPGESSTPGQYVGKLGCYGPHLKQRFVDDLNGDFTRYYQQRESRDGAVRVRAAMLMFHGHADQDVQPTMQAGLFERLPATTPKAGIFGVFEHSLPSLQETAPEWRRADWPDILAAWFDQYLKGLPSGADSWPVAQVQGSDGQWRAEPEWPTTGGPVGQLALAQGGRLGAASGNGSTAFREIDVERRGEHIPPSAAVFETDPLPERLEITGQPVLDVWVSLDRPDAHLAATLEAIGGDGAALPYTRAWGARSMRHLDPLTENRFAQASGRPAPVATPIRVTLRFNPTDIVVPAGARLRLVVSGSVRSGVGLNEVTGYFPLPEAPNLDPLGIGQPTQPSLSFTTVTILHDCEHPSALRFLMPRANPDLLNVREPDEPATQPLVDNRPFVAPVSDAGGLATAPVCGQAPIRLDNFGPEIPYVAPN